MAPGWYAVQSGPLWTTYQWSDGASMPSKTFKDPGGYGIAAGLKYGVASPQIPSVETSLDTAWDIYFAFHAAPWTFALGWGVEHGDIEDIAGFDANVSFSTPFAEVGRSLDFLPAPFGIDVVAVLGLGAGKLDSPSHLDSSRVLTYRPSVRLLKTLRTTPSMSAVLQLEGRYSYSRELTFANETFNYRCPTFLGEIALRF